MYGVKAKSVPSKTVLIPTVHKKTMVVVITDVQVKW